MLNDEKITKLATLQLQLAVLNGEPWAVKHILGGTRLEITETKKFDLSSLSNDDLKQLHRMIGDDQLDDLDEIEEDSCSS